MKGCTICGNTDRSHAKIFFSANDRFVCRKCVRFCRTDYVMLPDYSIKHLDRALPEA